MRKISKGNGLGGWLVGVRKIRARSVGLTLKKVAYEEGDEISTGVCSNEEMWVD